MSRANLYVMNPNDEWVPYRTNSEMGFQSGASGGGSASVIPTTSPTTVLPWYYAAAAGGITDTADVTLVAAAGAGKSNYLTSLQLINKHASTGTEVIVKSGSTVLWRGYAPATSVASGPVNITFSQPLQSANNTALTAACVTNATATLINAQGYQDATIEAIRAQQSDETELFDDLGNLLTDDSGNAITVP